MVELGQTQLAYFTEVDHNKHEALDPRTAEVAIAVADEWQCKGLATLLVHKLVDRARAAVLSRFSATCLADNAVVTSCVVLCAKLLRGGSRSSRLTGCRRGAESSKDVAPEQ